MIIGIDASNIRTGGGLNYLFNLLKEAYPVKYKFTKIIVWSSNKTLMELPTQTWLIKKNSPLLNKLVFYSTLWKLLKRDRIVKKYGCNVLFLADATYSRFHPSITVCHNILPFSKEAIANFSFIDCIYISLMRFNALAAFKSSNHIIMLSNNSIEVITQYYKDVSLKSIIIPHGFNKYFESAKSIGLSKNDKIYNLIYISPLSPYKLQWKVVAAIHILLDQGYNVELTLIGNELNGAKVLVDNAIVQRPEYSSKIIYKGEVPNQELPKLLAKSNVFIFASLCETFGISLLEAMSTGIPIACSNRSAMPEILRDGGVYFDPNSEIDIAKAIKEIINNPELAELKSKQAIELSKEYSWEKCAKTTLELLELLVNVGLATK